MKIRQGFVSNSSSSSFIVVGIEGKISDKIKEELENDNSKFCPLEWYQEDKEGICIKIASWSDEDWPDDIELSIIKINEIEKQIKEKFYPEIATNRAKVYAGRCQS